MVATEAPSGETRTSSAKLTRKAFGAFLALSLTAGLLPAGTAFADTAAAEYGTVAGVSSIMFAPDAKAAFKTQVAAETDATPVPDVEKVMDSLVSADRDAADAGSAEAATPTEPADPAVTEEDTAQTPAEADLMAGPVVVCTPVSTIDELKTALLEGDSNIEVTAPIAITEPIEIDYEVVIDLSQGELDFVGPHAHLAVVNEAYVTLTEGTVNGENLYIAGADTPADDEAAADDEADAADNDAAVPQAADRDVDEALIDVADATLILDDVQVVLSSDANIALRIDSHSNVRLINGTVVSYDGSGVIVQTEGVLTLNSAALLALRDATALQVDPEAIVSVDATSQIASQEGIGVFIDGGLRSETVSFNCVGLVSGQEAIVFGENTKITNGTFPFKIDSVYLSDDVSFLIVIDSNFLYTSAGKDAVMAAAPVGSKVYPVIKGMVNYSDETVIQAPAATEPDDQTPITPTPVTPDPGWSELEVVTPEPTTQTQAGPTTPLNSSAVTVTVNPINPTTTAAPIAGTMDPGIAGVTQYLLDDATPLSQGLINSGSLFGSFSDPEGIDILADSAVPFRGGSDFNALDNAEYASTGISWLPLIIGAAVLAVVGAAVILIMKRRSETAALVALLDDEEEYYDEDPYDYY